MVVGCVTGCDHGQMWWNDATMQDVERHVKCGATVKCGVMRDVVGRCIMCPIYGGI